MDRKYYDDLKIKTETHTTFILVIQVQGENTKRYVSKKEREMYNDEEIGKDIAVFLVNYRYPFNTNYNIQMLTQIQTISTTILTADVFKNPYVKEVE